MKVHIDCGTDGLACGNRSVASSINSDQLCAKCQAAIRSRIRRAVLTRWAARHTSDAPGPWIAERIIEDVFGN